MNELAELVQGQIVLVIAPHAGREGMLQLAGALARRGPLRVLDGGNQFNAYQVARAVRRHSTDLDQSLERISLARAFTCYQMEALLLGSRPEPYPTLVLDFLSTFGDENVPYSDRRRLLQHCAHHLRRLGREARIVISARPSSQEYPPLNPSIQKPLPSALEEMPNLPSEKIRANSRNSRIQSQGESSHSAIYNQQSTINNLQSSIPLLGVLRAVADQVLEWEAPAPPAVQPALLF